MSVDVVGVFHYRDGRQREGWNHPSDMAALYAYWAGLCDVMTCHAPPYAQSPLERGALRPCLHPLPRRRPFWCTYAWIILAVTTIQTPLCALIGIDVPVVQAPIGSWPELAAAVSNAGGLWMLALSWEIPARSPADSETSNLTAAPFGMNLKLDEDQHIMTRGRPRGGRSGCLAVLGTTRG